MTNQSKPDEAYFDRNQAAMLVAKLAQKAGMNVGVGIDPDEPLWPVLYVDLPTGQVSWHMPQNELSVVFPLYEGKWDGSSVEEKRTRIAEFLSNQ